VVRAKLFGYYPFYGRLLVSALLSLAELPCLNAIRQREHVEIVSGDTAPLLPALQNPDSP
jgi:hypothetical protein